MRKAPKRSKPAAHASAPKATPRRPGAPRRLPRPNAASIARNGIASLREPVKGLNDEQALDLARRCRAAADAKKADDVVMLDIRRRANFADYFVIATGRSVLQARAIADAIVEATENEYGSPVRTEGYNEGGWILVDYGAVIAHVFTPQAREFYDLERLWGKPDRAKKRQAE